MDDQTKSIILGTILIVVIFLFVVWLYYVGYFSTREGMKPQPKYNTPLKNPDIPRVRNSKTIVTGSDLKEPREVANWNLKQVNPIQTRNFVLNQLNPLGLTMQESSVFRRD